MLGLQIMLNGLEKLLDKVLSRIQSLLSRRTDKYNKSKSGLYSSERVCLKIHTANLEPRFSSCYCIQANMPVVFLPDL